MARDETHDRKAATRSLGRGLRIVGLVLGRVEQLERCTINGFEPMSSPELPGFAPRFGMAADHGVSRVEELFGETLPCTAIGGGPGPGHRQARLIVPTLHKGERLGAGTVARKDLGEPAPEGYHFRENTVPQCFGHGPELLERQHKIEEGPEVGDRFSTGLFASGAERFELTPAGPALKFRRKTRQESCCSFHTLTQA